MYVYIYIYIYKYVCILACNYIYIYICLCIYVHVCIYIFIYMCVYMCVYVCTYIFMYICLYIFFTYVYLYLIVYNWCKNGHFNISLIYFELGKHVCIFLHCFILWQIYTYLPTYLPACLPASLPTYLFKLVWNTHEITWTRCFLIMKRFLCLNALPCCFFLHIFEVKVSNVYWPITWEM